MYEFLSMKHTKLSFLILIFILADFGLFAQIPVAPAGNEIGFIEKQGQFADLDVRLINEKGDIVILRDLINKPTILNLVYFRCPGTCSPLMWGVSKFIDEVDLKLGTDYQVLTVSFDPNESIDLGIKKKANYVSSLKNKDLGNYWYFFVSDSANISRLCESVGFHYKIINSQYVHPTGLIALAADGKITRYLRGMEFLPFDIKITMVEAADGKIGPSINRLLAICYSQKGNDFVFNVLKVSGIVIGFFIIVILSILFFPRKPINKREKL
jgi:protein SCO1/2